MTNAEREAFELLPDDERQCEVCKTTCFMSAISCKCSSDILVCLRHYSSLCKCSAENRTLRYRYTLDELLPLLRNLKTKAESFDRWADKVKDALDRSTPKSLTLNELKALLAEADGKHFPKSDLIQTLVNAVEDSEKCASVIKQLDLNKIRTRNSNDNRSKLTLEEITLFCEEIDSLACVLDEEKIIKDLLERTTQFEKDSERFLEMPLMKCTLTDIEQCINNTDGLCIELPSLNAMTERFKQLKWLKDVNGKRKSAEGFDIDSLKKLMHIGLQLKSAENIVEVLSELQNLVTEAEEWEENAQSLLNKPCTDVMTEVEELVKEAADIEVYLPSENLLVDSLNSTNEWFKMLNEMNGLEFYPYLNSVEELIKRSKNIPFYLSEAEKLKTYVGAAHSWKEKTSRTFLRKSSALTLMEALSPRMQMSPTKLKRKHQEDDGTYIKLTDDMDPAAVVAVFKDAEEREMKAIKNLRSLNLAKSLDPADGALFCVCFKSLSNMMMQCELCKDWFHSTCVQLPKLASIKMKGNLRNALMYMGFKDSKFLCPNCYRTRRPRLESILSLLMSLQKLRTRLPEGEALQCLTERAMNWQDRARHLLQTSEMEACTTKFNQIAQKFTEAAARVKTEKIISAELKKAAKNPELHIKMQQIALLSGLMDDKDDSGCGSPDHSISSEDVMFKDNDLTTDEHAYSLTASKVDEKDCILQLSTHCFQQLEDLVLEGDLLEVSLDETQQLWQLLQASRDCDKNPFLIDFDVSTIL